MKAGIAYRLFSLQFCCSAAPYFTDATLIVSEVWTCPARRHLRLQNKSTPNRLQDSGHPIEAMQPFCYLPPYAELAIWVIGGSGLTSAARTAEARSDLAVTHTFANWERSQSLTDTTLLADFTTECHRNLLRCGLPLARRLAPVTLTTVRTELTTNGR